MDREANVNDAVSSKPWYKKWWGIAIIAVFAIGLIQAVGQGLGLIEPPAQEASKAVIRKPTVTRISEKTAAPFGDFAMVYSGAGTLPSFQSMESEARTACEGLQNCNVVAFDDVTFAPTAWPMTEREAGAVIFSYSLNRATGHEKALAKCGLVPETQSDMCMASAK